MIIIQCLISIFIPVCIALNGIRIKKYLKSENGRLECNCRGGFNTRRTKKDAELWLAANVFFSHMSVCIGINITVVSIIAFLAAAVHISSGRWLLLVVIVLAQVICMAVLLFLTEVFVRKQIYSQKGKKRNKKIS